MGHDKSSSGTKREYRRKKVTKAKAKIILAIDPIVYAHVTQAVTAKEVWENLQKAFDDNGLERRVLRAALAQW